MGLTGLAAAPHGTVPASPWPAELRTPRRLQGFLRSLLIYHRPWRRRRLDRFYRQLLPAGGLAFDVGAHVGDRTACFRRLGARVVAVEPQPGFAGFLAWLFRNDAGVTVLPAALAATAGSLDLSVSATTPTVASGSAAFRAHAGSLPSFEGVAWQERLTVPTTTLDALIRAHGRPDLVKIDVEGMEAMVLAGLAEPVPALSFEVLPGAAALAAACLAELRRLGRWRFNLVMGEDLAFCAAGWIDEAGLGRLLDRLDRSGRSGDVYARLCPPA